MKSLFETMTDYMTEKGLHYSRNEGCTSLTLCYRLKNANFTLNVQTDEERRYLKFHTRSSIIVPDDKAVAVSEFIARVNYWVHIGSFQFDQEDGDLFFQTTHFPDETEVSFGEIRHLLSRSINTYDYFYPALVDVIYRHVDPLEALKYVKGMKRPQHTQEEMDAVFAKLLAGMEELQPVSGFDAIKAQVGQHSEGIMIPMKELVSAAGQKRAGKHIVQGIEQNLRACGLGHIPATLPCSRNTLVLVYDLESANH